MIPLPEELPRDQRTPFVYWMEVVGKDKPALTCRLKNGKATVHLPGMVDTGADVTIIARVEWPAQWGLRASRESITGIGGTAQSIRNSAPIIIEGPDGHTASVRPFVVLSGFTLWGRDVLSQWRTRLEIPARGF